MVQRHKRKYPSRKHTNIIADLVREARKEADLKDQEQYEQLLLESESDADKRTNS